MNAPTFFCQINLKGERVSLILKDLKKKLMFEVNLKILVNVMHFCDVFNCAIIYI